MASDLTFDVEWLDPQGARGEELRATWARLEMRVDDEPVIRLYDRRADTVRESVYAPLYPLAEWLAIHWWSLCFEVRSRSSQDEEGYSLRHRLTQSREGYAFPPLAFESQIDRVRLSWTSENLPAHKAEHLAVGSASFHTARLQEALVGFVDKVALRLEAQGVRGTLLQEEWHAIQEADEEEQAFCAAAAALGLDPYDLDDDLRSAIELAGNRLPESIQREFFAAADVSTLNTSTTQLTTAIEVVRGTSARLQSLFDLRDRTLTPLQRALLSSEAPWSAGYQLAWLVRREFGLDGRPLPTIEDLGNKLQLDVSALENAIVMVDLPHALDAILAGNTVGSPGFGLRSGLPQRDQPYHFCRVLHEFLVQHVADTSLVSDAPSYAQKANRAFAAEFLAPASGIKQQLRGRMTVSFEEIDELAAHFGVAPLVIEHQIQNHLLAHIPSTLD